MNLHDWLNSFEPFLSLSEEDKQEVIENHARWFPIMREKFVIGHDGLCKPISFFLDTTWGLIKPKVKDYSLPDLGQMYVAEIRRNKCKVGWSKNIKVRLQAYKHSSLRIEVFEDGIPLFVEEQFHKSNHKGNRLEWYDSTFNKMCEKVRSHIIASTGRDISPSKPFKFKKTKKICGTKKWD